jgi:hypothetical protein
MQHDNGQQATDNTRMVGCAGRRSHRACACAGTLPWQEQEAKQAQAAHAAEQARLQKERALKPL